MNMATQTAFIATILFFCMNLTAFSGEPTDVVAYLKGLTLSRTDLPSHGRASQTQSAIGLPPANGTTDVAALIDWVLRIRKKEAIDHWKIVISDDDVQKKLEKIVGDPQEFIRKNNEVLLRLPRALRMARAEPERSDEIFEQELKGLISYSLWRAHVGENDDEGKLCEIEQCPPMDMGGVDDMRRGIRDFLAERKLREVVAGMKATEAEREECWQVWCRQQVISSDVLVQDEALRADYEQTLKTWGGPTENGSP